MKIFEVTENISHTSKRLRDIEQERNVKIGSDEWFKLWFSLPYLKKNLKESSGHSYMLQLERDNRAGMLVLHILDNKTGKRTEVRGKLGYETNGYDPEDKLHQILDKIGKSASVSDLMNGDVVSINPRHPQGPAALKVAHDLTNESNPFTDARMNAIKAGKTQFKVGGKTYKVTGDTRDEREAVAKISESLDQPYPYSWYIRSEDNWAARAKTDSGGILEVWLEYSSWDALWDVEFLLDGGYKATAEGDQFRIFATVVKAIKEWWKSTSEEGLPVKTIRFSADKLNKQTGKTGSRERLYSRFAQQFANSIGFTVQNRDNTNATEFELINPNYSKRKVNEAVESGKEMLKIFRGMHHDAGMNKAMDRYIRSNNWQLGNFTPDMFPSEEEFFDYDDPFDRTIDIDYSHRVNLSAPIIVGPQYSDGKYSVIDGNHRAATAQKMGKTIQAYFPVKKTNEARTFAPQQTPMQDLVNSYLFFTSFGQMGTSDGAKSPDSAEKIKEVVRALSQSHKNLQNLDKQTLEKNKNKILTHVHDMMNYAIAHFKEHLTPDNFQAKRKQINDILTKYNNLTSTNENVATEVSRKVTKESLGKLTQWKNKEPAGYVTHLQKFFGPPEELTDKRAIWYNKDGFKRIEILDEFILHSSPLPHYDYAYSYVDMKVPHNLSDELAASSESILIDHLKGEVGARCASLSANAVTLQYVMDVVEGNIEPAKDEYEARIKAMKKMFSDGERFELDWWPDVTGDTDPDNPYYKDDVDENFADGKNPGRKGLAKRSGVNTKASVSDLRKTAKNSSGEKQRMAHWLANMKSGKDK